jgi:beta-glucosidase-like glycosyl hydrolase
MNFLFLFLFSSLSVVVCALAQQVLPHTCAPLSPSSSLPFCDYTLPLEARVEDLLSRLNSSYRVAMYSAPAEKLYYEPSLNLKQVGMWQSSVIHGLCGAQNDYNVTVFPHALALAATFDTALVQRVSWATWLEARIVHGLAYAQSGGTVWANTIAAGGPLANTQHDPRYGRVPETYGEDPWLAAAMGAALVQGVQNRSAEGFVAVAVVTRHWLGYHQAAPDNLNGGEEYIDAFSFAEQQELPYRSCLSGDAAGGGSEGLMCAMSAFSVGERSDWNTSRAPLIPSCLHPFLWSTLREGWNVSSAFVQTDCCDSITEMAGSHHYTPSLSASLVAALEAGVEGSFGLTNAQISPTLAALLSNGTVPPALLEQRLRRTLLARFHAGEFDFGANPKYPFAGPFDASALDGGTHRALAREAAAASLVLLRNEGGVLPLPAAGLPAAGLPAALLKVAVVGPWADCHLNYRTNDVDSPLQCNYLHSYTGRASSVSTVLQAAREEAGFEVTYAQGSNLISALGMHGEGVAAAAAAAAAADVVVLCLGLGSLVEREGLDRVNLTLPAPQLELLRAVAKAAAAPRRLVTVVFSGGLVDMPYQLSHAVLQALYPGEETGHGVLDTLLGRSNPSARLPLTAFTQAYADASEPLRVFALQGGRVGRTYRFYNGSDVHFWFGFGLSYSNFTFGGAAVQVVAPLPPPAAAPDTLVLAVLNVTVQNTGSAAGAEVVQAYVSVPALPDAAQPAPPRFSLAAFAKTRPLAPGEKVLVSLPLTLRSFQTTNASGARAVLGGNYTVWVAGHMPEDALGPSNVERVAVTLPVAPPPPAPAPLLEVQGVFEVETGPSTLQWWNPSGKLLLFESIFCGYWGHAGQWDARFAGHSYYRVRDFGTGAVVVNLTLSVGFAYGSAFVDHAATPPRFYIFGTPHDRCGHATMPNNTGVWVFWSDHPTLAPESWQRAQTDVAWNLDGHGANVDVAAVLGPSPPGLPPHKYIMMTDRATFAVNAGQGGDLSLGWGVLPPPVGAPNCPGGCQCPSIRFLPSDGNYYVVSGGHSIWLMRSADLVHWEVAGNRTPIIKPSAGDGGVVNGLGGSPANLNAADKFYREKGRNTSREMLQHLENWDFNSNDADFCCESWGGASEVRASYFNYGASSQATPPTGGLNGPTAFQALALSNLSLGELLPSFF